MSRAAEQDFVLGTKASLADENISHIRLPTEEQVCTLCSVYYMYVLTL